jgi:hypothetical protein
MYVYIRVYMQCILYRPIHTYKYIYIQYYFFLRLLEKAIMTQPRNLPSFMETES